LENLKDVKDVNRKQKKHLKNIKTTAKENLALYELKQHDPWFDEKCSRFVDERSRIKCSGYRNQPKAM
jgi:hypothetical protein